MTDLQQKFQFGEFLVEPTYNTLSRNGESQQVPPRVMDLLAYLIAHHERLVTAEELLSTFWPGRIVEESTIHRHISQIRTALGDSAREPSYIKTVSKRGYQAIAEVRIEAMPSGPTARPAPAPPNFLITDDQPETTVMAFYVQLDYAGQSFGVPPNRAFTIGRSADCDITLNTRYASRVHGQVESDETGRRYRDLSQNGTFISSPLLPGSDVLVKQDTIELPAQGELRIADEQIAFWIKLIRG